MTTDNFSTEKYNAQLNDKIDRIEQQFSSFNPPAISVYPSTPTGYRMRAEFKVWHDGESSNYAMYKKGEYKQPYIIKDFPAGYCAISKFMPIIQDEITRSETLRRKLFQIEFLTTLSGEVLVTFIYHKKLDDAWQEAAQALMEKLDIFIIGRSRGQKLVLKQDYVTESLNVNNKCYQYQQVESSFTQPNALVCQKMLTWAVDNSKHFSGDLVELYCGNGNFTLPLSQNFEQVLATELAKSSVHSANFNIALNSINNITVVRMSSEDFSDALDEVREFRRLKDINLGDYNFSTIFVDPPRSGMDDHTTEITQRFDNIIYISCNPDTLFNNLKRITQTHDITQFAIFDQFPFTDHIECGVILKKKTLAN